MVHHLVMPAPFSGFDIQRNKTGSEEVVAWAMSTVIVDRRTIRRNIDQSEFGVGGHRSPRRHITGPFPRIIFPGVVPKFTRSGYDIKLPFEITGIGIVSEDIARYVFDPRLQIPLLSRIPNYDSVINHNRGRRARNVTNLERHPRIGVVRSVHTGPGTPVCD